MSQDYTVAKELASLKEIKQSAEQRISKLSLNALNYVDDHRLHKTGGGGGTGGGVLVCTMDMQTTALDKTWAEINDADLAFMSFNMDDIKATGLVALTTSLESEYKVEVIAINMRDMSIGTLHFAAESADGYPVVSQ